MRDKSLLGSHGDVVVSGNRAWWFYFTEHGRKAAIDVVELTVADGQLIPGDPDQLSFIDLKPERELEK